MKRTLVEVYALAVCFVTLVCFVVAFGIGIEFNDYQQSQILKVSGQNNTEHSIKSLHKSPHRSHSLSGAP